jgi:hypothetical protein
MVYYLLSLLKIDQLFLNISDFIHMAMYGYIYVYIHTYMVTIYINHIYIYIYICVCVCVYIYMVKELKQFTYIQPLTANTEFYN